MSEHLVDSAYVRRLFGGRSSIWVNRAKKSGLLPQPKKISGRDYWPRSAVHEIAGIPVPAELGAVA